MFELQLDISGLPFTPLPHQIKTAKKVIENMNGRALLADEVGLGKTIEAGLILKEYIARGEVNNFLILVPASLGVQWTNEIVNKFQIENVLYNRKGRGWPYFQYQIASLALAKRTEHAQLLKNIKFDMVIVDEAHQLKNRTTLNWKFVNSLDKKYLLLLTATPIQNNIKELYNLISLVYPEKYKDYSSFKKLYNIKKKSIGKKELLKEDLNQIMIRNYHENTELNKKPRLIRHIAVELTDKEKLLYDKMSSYLSREYTKNQFQKGSILNLLTYQRELCSSSFALQQTLHRKYQKDKKLNKYLKEIFNLASSINRNAKLEAVEKIAANNRGEHLIIFTEFKATQLFLKYYLDQKGHKTLLFNGGLSFGGKEWVKKLFKNKYKILISTEAGSQGLNFQFSSIVINYDLPWNPMKIEQRIGRIDRFGQKKQVKVFNLATRNTIEEKILIILYKKIKLFKQIMGKMDDLIWSSEENDGPEKEILEYLINNNKEINKL